MYCAASWFSHRNKHFLQGDGSGESRTNAVTFAHLYLADWLVWQYGSGQLKYRALCRRLETDFFFKVMGLFSSLFSRLEPFRSR